MPAPPDLPRPLLRGFFRVDDPLVAERYAEALAHVGVTVPARRAFHLDAAGYSPEIAADLGCASWGQFFLKWVVSHPAVTCVIPGTSKPKHMLDNAMAGHGALPDEAMRQRMRNYVLG